MEFLADEAPQIVEAFQRGKGGAILSREIDGREPEGAVPICAGIAPATRKGEYLLAIRLGVEELQHTRVFSRFVEKYDKELDVQVIGETFALNQRWNQERVRPLQPGVSVAHVRVTAGTLGAFVSPKKGGPMRMLSNNHVLANTNRGKKGDKIVQPGSVDSGSVPEDVVGVLDTFKMISFTKPNQVDAAVATVNRGIETKVNSFRGIGRIREIVPPETFLADSPTVLKVGRTTGKTVGRVTAIEVDGIRVSFGGGKIARFDGQIEIGPDAEQPFSAPGDSGSLVVSSDRCATGLLFAGTQFGSLTFANPIELVLDGFGVELVLG